MSYVEIFINMCKAPLIIQSEFSKFSLWSKGKPSILDDLMRRTNEKRIHQ